MNAPAIDVVIPTWNGRELLERCLHTLAAQTRAHAVFVVDNGSSDGTTEMLAADFPNVRLIELHENRGFGPAVNVGIGAGSSPYVVLVNNDVECDPEFIERLVEPFDRAASCGMVAALLLKPGRNRIDSYGLELDRTLSAFARYAGRPYPQTPLDERHLAGPSGGAAAYRREALSGAGNLDEAIFAYMEDADLALRIATAGWTCAGARRATGVHLGSATFDARSRRTVEIAAASRAYMLRKYGVLSQGLGVALWTAAIEFAVALAESLAGRDLAPLRGRVEGWRRAGGCSAPVPDRVINHEIRFLDAMRKRWAAWPGASRRRQRP